MRDTQDSYNKRKKLAQDHTAQAHPVRELRTTIMVNQANHNRTSTAVAATLNRAVARTDNRRHLCMTLNHKRGVARKAACWESSSAKLRVTAQVRRRMDTLRSSSTVTVSTDMAHLWAHQWAAVTTSNLADP
jgi:hypothetical protein